jgi:hypothetical protein
MAGTNLWANPDKAGNLSPGNERFRLVYSLTTEYNSAYGFSDDARPFSVTGSRGIGGADYADWYILC